jgi:hypothetical protein
MTMRPVQCTSEHRCPSGEETSRSTTQKPQALSWRKTTLVKIVQASLFFTVFTVQF